MAEGSGQAPLASGESVSVPIRVRSNQGYPRNFSGEPGLYRVRFYLSSIVSGEYHQLPYRASVSSAFTVTAR
jgi:hypothetical protein